MKRTRVRVVVDRAGSRLLARVPWLGRVWARRASLVRADTVPWTPFTTPLDRSRVMLVTTGGVHLRADRPFDMENADGDATFRVIPAAAAVADLRITHDYYDHRDADRDPNIVFPFERFRELVGRGIVGGLTREHVSFMGHIAGPLVRVLEERSVPALLARLAGDRPDFVFLTPA